MTQEKYYKGALSTLKNGEKYLLDMIGEYPVRKTEDGIQPIIYVKSRIKSPESMMRKLWKKGWKTDADTALKRTNDAVGVRVICSFEEEVYQVTEWLCKRKEIQVIEKKDYIAYPKPNGYRSLHLIVKVRKGELEGMTAEIQLRTIALDFWAVLEHQMKYKQSIAHESIIQNELKRCADEIASVDISMQTIRELLRNTEWEEEVTVHTGY